MKKIFNLIFLFAKDVKLQVDFNPQLVDSYRLIGYENRLLQKQDFKNDAKDAGELGAGIYMIPLLKHPFFFAKRALNACNIHKRFSEIELSLQGL